MSMLGSLVAQPANWENFSATGCKGNTMSIKTALKENNKPILLIWEGYDCGFCREEGAQCAKSAQNYGNIIMYWNAFGRINGNATCEESEDWAKEYGNPASNFVFLDKGAEDNWSQPAPGQGRWYFVISQDKVTKAPKMLYSGNIINDAEIVARKAVKDFTLANEKALSLLSSFKLYPNPANDYLQIEIQLKSAANVVAEAVDLTGKSQGIVINGNYTQINQKIDLSNYAKGMYILNYKIDGLPYSQLFTVN